MDGLSEIKNQSYPLEVDMHTAQELVRGIAEIMKAVPSDDQVFVRHYYNEVTSALVHPAPEAT